MAAPSRNDPYKDFNFRVEIDGISLGAFSEVGGLESETAVIEYREGGEPNTVRKLPGLTKFANIVLRRGITQDAELWSWQKNIIDGKPDRRSGAIVLLDDEGNEVVRWNFVEGWICKWEGPALSARGDEVAVETIVIAHAAPSAPDMDAVTPDDGVVVDVILEDGVFYLELTNLADRPAWNVTSSFARHLSMPRGGTCRSWVCSATWRFSGRGDGCARYLALYPATSEASGPRALQSPSNTSGWAGRAVRRR